MKHTFTVEDLEHLLAIEGSTPDAISYGDFALLGRARNAGLAKLRTHKEKPALHIIRVSDSKIRMLEKYSSIESVWGIWAPSKHAPAVDMLFTLCAIGSVSAMVTFMVMAAVL